MTRSQPGPLLPVRTALVLLLAVLAGVGGGVLTVLGGEPWPAAVMVGGAATGAALVLFHNLIG